MLTYQGPVRGMDQVAIETADIAGDCLERAKRYIDDGQFEQGLLDLDLVLDLIPGQPHAHWNRGQALLSLGDYINGFQEFEWRRRIFLDPLHDSGIALWRGESLITKCVLFYHEHGLGDSVMLARFVPVLQRMGAARVVVVAPCALHSLFRQFGVEVHERVPPFLNFDYRLPMFSILAMLKYCSSNIPCAPYLHPSPTLKHKWRKIIGHHYYTSIGVCWSGNRKHQHDARRSIDLQLFLDLLEHDHRHLLVAVQKSELNVAASYGIKTFVFDDLADCMALMAVLDHIVCVDSAPIHLAGAMGHPSAHLLLSFVSDWRWYQSKAWYPTLNVHRQARPGDWPSAFKKANLWLD